MKRLPLSGVRVLVGRAHHQASVLSAELRKHGANVIEIPFIEIRKPRSFKPLDNALTNLRDYDWLILTSVNGVEAMWDRLGQLKVKWGQPPLRQAQGRLPAVRSSEARHTQGGPFGHREGRDPSASLRASFSRSASGRKPAALAAEDPRSGGLRVAAIGPAQKKLSNSAASKSMSSRRNTWPNPWSEVCGGR